LGNRKIGDESEGGKRNHGIEICENLGPGEMYAEGEVVCSINSTLFRTLEVGSMVHWMYEKRKYTKGKTGLNLGSYISRLKTVPKPFCPNSEHGQDLGNFTIYNLEGTFGMVKRSDCSRIPPPF
jgi:hypothetical protein